MLSFAERRIIHAASTRSTPEQLATRLHALQVHGTPLPAQHHLRETWVPIPGTPLEMSAETLRNYQGWKR